MSLSPSRLGDGDSYTNQEGISAMSNNDPFAPNVQLAPESSPLHLFHKSVLTLKCKIIRLLAFLFYKPDEYGMVNYICHVV